ncbi:MAG TPA: FG-GAP-like repeat-containing protein [Candidatus Limnocylindrales bacterium]|nr:FG-GAP-like repeat-containing protein [Candidatus Limnocylindrales bacterium]
MQKLLVWVVLALALAGAVIFFVLRKQGPANNFTGLMTRGQGYLEKGDATNAIAAYSKALELAPESIDAHLDLANGYLLAGNNQAVLDECQQVLKYDHSNAAAYYLMGCAYQHLNQPEKAVQAFQESQKIDPAVTALNFQLGLAQERAGHLDEAIQEFETVVQFEPDHPSAHYQLSRLYQRANRQTDAAAELAKHQQILAKNPSIPAPPLGYERCKYTLPRVAFVLEQPDPTGVAVRFVDASTAAFGQRASAYRGPLGVIDYNHDGRNSLFVMEGNGFRLLNNTQGQFAPMGEVLPGATNGGYRRCLVGDLNNDRFDDVLVLGEEAAHAFRFATNGQFREVTAACGLKGFKARDGVLADLDFTGKLDLLTILPGSQGLRLYRNLGSFYFQDHTNSGLPLSLTGVQQVATEDWNNEDVPGVFATHAGQVPLFFAKQRAGSFVQTNIDSSWPAGNYIAFGDLNNDLLVDFALADEHDLHVVFGGLKERPKLSLQGLQVKGLLLIDYDNDGWLDIIAYGSGLRVWRNLGKTGFTEVTTILGLDKIGAVDGLVAADFDQDGDTDLVLSTATGLQFWRNDGGNSNKQLKLQLVGNRSNSSALGARVEIVAGNWHTIRTKTQLPLEIGVGKHTKIDLLKTHWFDLATTLVDLTVPSGLLTDEELMLPTGSCPNLYAWSGKQFKFVTDILGAAPMGLPSSASHFIDADPEEFLALGNEQQFPMTNGNYELRITEELREVLYLEQAKLFVVDHPAGTLVHSTSKMLPRKPFPPHELRTLRPRASLQQATRNDGCDVTEILASTDNRMVSPVRLREPQLRGLAEPFAITLDFGELPTDEPLVLVLTGWLRFGGGMANIAASLDPNLPFPFPTLEAELPDGTWKTVPTEVGTPAGKTKTILVDLDQKLPQKTRRLRLSSAFEIHWDSASLCVRASADQNHVTSLAPARAELRWHGFGDYANLPEDLPLIPAYEKVRSEPPWIITPSGWCTRYGPVNELIAEKDNALVLLNGGDELALSFKADQLPSKPDGFQRDFFLYVVGWDKDADFHVGDGWRVDPLPFLGMDDQAYGRQPRPAGFDDAWIAKYNTRWVGPRMLTRTTR